MPPFATNHANFQELVENPREFVKHLHPICYELLSYSKSCPPEGRGAVQVFAAAVYFAGWQQRNTFDEVGFAYKRLSSLNYHSTQDVSGVCIGIYCRDTNLDTSWL